MSASKSFSCFSALSLLLFTSAFSIQNKQCYCSSPLACVYCSFFAFRHYPIVLNRDMAFVAMSSCYVYAVYFECYCVT